MHATYLVLREPECMKSSQLSKADWQMAQLVATQVDHPKAAKMTQFVRHIAQAVVPEGEYA